MAGAPFKPSVGLSGRIGCSHRIPPNHSPLKIQMPRPSRHRKLPPDRSPRPFRPPNQPKARHHQPRRFQRVRPKQQHHCKSQRRPFSIPKNSPTQRSVDRQQHRGKQRAHPDSGQQQVPRHVNSAVEVQSRSRLHQHHRHGHNRPLQPRTRTNRPRLPLTLAKQPRLSRSQQHLPILAVRRLRIAKSPHRDPVRFLRGTSVRDSRLPRRFVMLANLTSHLRGRIRCQMPRRFSQPNLRSAHRHASPRIVPTARESCRHSARSFANIPRPALVMR
jgi:hypothetical protein